MIPSVYTSALNSGNVLVVATEITYADAVISGLLLLFVGLICIELWRELMSSNA